MKTAAALGLVPLVLFTLAGSARAAPSSEGASSLEASRRTLEAARKTLAQSVERIQRDPPSTADLDAAHAAVNALKDAVDAGAGNEQQDLEYAKAALAARKELRTQRDYVTQRRAKIYLFNHRRTLDAALGAMKERGRRVEGKEAGPKEIEDARASAQEVRKAVEEARPFAAQDEEFAKYLATVEAALARQEKACGERETQLAVGKQRPLFEESRRGLAASMARLGAGASDAQFKDADRAAAALAQRLEQGQALEAKDATYRAEADRARAELTQARKRLDELWSATGLERLKSEIEPARKDLVAAAQAARGKDATEEQLAEERTAAFVVRKLLEKFQPEATRSRAFGQYVSEVTKTLVEVEVGIQRRSLDAARAEVGRTLRPIERRAPTEAQFAEAEAALAQLEKTLAAIPNPEAAIASRVADARALLHSARATVGKRRAEASLESATAAVTQALRPLERRSPTDEQFAEATTALTVLEKTLEAVPRKDAPEAVTEARAKLRDARAAVERRRVEVGVERQRIAVEKAREHAAAVLSQLQQPDDGNRRVLEAEAAVKQLQERLDEGAALTPKDREYAAYDREVRKRIAELNARITRQKIVLAAGEGRATLDAKITDARSKLQAAKQPEATGSDLDGASQKVDAVREALEAQLALEEQDRGYAAHAARAREALDGLREELGFATQAHTLRRRTVEALAAGASTKGAAAEARDIRAQKKQYEVALAHFKTCENAGTALLEKNRALANVAVLVEGRLSTPKEVIDLCVQRSQATGQLLKQVEGLIAFEEGPRKAYERAQELLDRSKKSEALEQFGECIATGKILEYGNPELKDRTFRVSGTSMTLAELVKRCIQHRDSLQPR